MKKYVPEIDGLSFAVAIAAVIGSTLLSYLIRGVSQEVALNFFGIVFLIGPLAALFVYYASRLSEQD